MHAHTHTHTHINHSRCFIKVRLNFQFSFFLSFSLFFFYFYFLLPGLVNPLVLFFASFSSPQNVYFFYITPRINSSSQHSHTHVHNTLSLFLSFFNFGIYLSVRLFFYQFFLFSVRVFFFFRQEFSNKLIGCYSGLYPRLSPLCMNLYAHGLYLNTRTHMNDEL